MIRCRISALGIVGDLLRKVGALELKLVSFDPDILWYDHLLFSQLFILILSFVQVSCRNIVKENGKENGEKAGFSSLNGIDRSKRIPRYTQWPIIWFWSKLKILISSGEDVVEKGYQSHFSWWLLCRVFCLYFSHLSRTLQDLWLTKLLLICHTSRTKLYVSVIYWDVNPAFAFSCWWCVIMNMLVFQGSLQPCSEEHVRVIILTQ